MKIFIAASGTGGHLFPALLVAKTLRKLEPACEVVFVGSGRALEAEVIDKGGFRRHVINTVGVKRLGVLGLLRFLWTLPRAFLQTYRLFSVEKPELVFGAGGYVSVLPVLMACLRGVPSWIHEAEIKPGLANYALSFFATKISVAFRETVMPCAQKVIVTGQPVREELVGIGNEAVGARVNGPPEHLLVLGGSQGAKALDDAMREVAPWLASQNIEVWHQGRPENVEALQAEYGRVRVKARVVSFIEAMPEALKWADLIVSRSGASTVMELGVVNKPAILVPYPFAQGQHQKANALTLVNAKKAILVEEGAGFVERLQEALRTLFVPANYQTMKAAHYAGRNADGAVNIARGLLALISSPKK